MAADNKRLTYIPFLPLETRGTSNAEAPRWRSGLARDTDALNVWNEATCGDIGTIAVANALVWNTKEVTAVVTRKRTDVGQCIIGGALDNDGIDEITEASSNACVQSTSNVHHGIVIWAAGSGIEKFSQKGTRRNNGFLRCRWWRECGQDTYYQTHANFRRLERHFPQLADSS